MSGSTTSRSYPRGQRSRASASPYDRTLMIAVRLRRSPQKPLASAISPAVAAPSGARPSPRTKMRNSVSGSKTSWDSMATTWRPTVPSAPSPTLPSSWRSTRWA